MDPNGLNVGFFGYLGPSQALSFTAAWYCHVLENRGERILASFLPRDGESRCGPVTSPRMLGDPGDARGFWRTMPYSRILQSTDVESVGTSRKGYLFTKLPGGGLALNQNQTPKVCRRSMLATGENH